MRTFAGFVLLLVSCTLGVAQETVKISATEAIWADKLVLRDSKLCPKDDQLPLNVVREAYFGRARSMSCTDAVLQLQDWDKLTDTSITKARSTIAQRLVEDYRRNCLVTFADITDPNGGYAGNRATSNHLVAISSEDEVRKVANSVGAMSRFNGPNYCSAALVRYTDTSVGLLTAAHCLGTVLYDEATATTKITATGVDMSFESIAGHKLSLELDSDFVGQIFDKRFGDAVILPIPGLVPDEFVALATFKPNLWDPLLIMGVSPFIAVGNPESQNDKLADLVAVSLEPSCVLMGRANSGTLYHNCQTTGGQSGSSVLTVRNRAVYVSGIHSRGNEVQNDCPKQPMPTLNAGIALIARD